MLRLNWRENKFQTMKKKNHLIALSVLIASLVGCNGGNDSSTTQPGSNNPTTPTAPSTQQPEKKTGTVTIGAVEHGSVTADKMTAEVGADVTFTVTPDENYSVKSFKVNNDEKQLNDSNQVVVKMVEGGLTVSAEFEINSAAVTITQADHGSISADKSTAKIGENVTFTVAPEANYVVSSFKVNDADVTLDGNNQAVVVMVAGGLNVTASFELGSGTVTIGTIEHGAVTADKMTAKIGEDVTFKITSDIGYDVSSFKVNGSDVDYVTKEDSTTGKTYWEAKVKMVSGGLTVTAEFKLGVYSIEWDTPTHGTIAVEGGKTSATYGEDVKFIFTPETGYEIKYLTINEEQVQWASDNTYTTTMGEYGLFVTVQFGLENETITVNAGEHGTIEHKNKADDSQDYKYGDTAVVTVTPNEGYMIETITVDGKAIEVPEDKKGGYSFEQLVEKDLNISATFTDVHTISEFTDSVINEIKNAQDIKVKLAGDVTLGVTLPLAKGTTEYDLDGHTITSTLNGMLRDANTDIATFGNKSVTLKNGSIISNYDKGTVNVIDSSYLAAFTLDGVTVSNSSISTVNPITGIYCSSTTETKILNSTINIKGSSNLGAYGIGTNNLDGENKTITIDNTKVTVTSDDFDNTGFLGNTEGIKVVVKNSTFTADRQAVIARTGNWDISGSTFVSTGKWLNASEANATTNTKYKTTAGSWKAGNEVVSGGLILGDERTSAYNTPVVATLKNNKFTVAKGDKMSIHSDGTVATTVTMDALTAVEAYGYDHDEDKTTVVTENNVVKSNIAEVVAKSEKDDTKLYYVTGVVKDIYDETHGNIHLLDKTTGQSMIVYGTYLTNEYLFDGSKFSFKQSDSTPITKEYIGKEITVAGTLGFHGGAGQIVNGFVLDAKADKYNDDLTVSYDNSKGTVVLSKENPQLGDEVTITATPKEGYRLSKVTLKTIDDVESDITSTLKFTAGLKDTITVEFVSDSTPVATVHEVVFNGENNNEPVGAYDKTWTNTTNGIKYVIVNGNNNTNKWDYIKFGRKKVASIGNIHTLSPFVNPIASSTITIDSITAAKVNSIKFYISTNEDFSNAEVHNLAIKTGVIETTVTTPVANAFYKYEFDCQSGSGNGFVQISKVTFTEKV
jgi:hypothetical protein